MLLLFPLSKILINIENNACKNASFSELFEESKLSCIPFREKQKDDTIQGEKKHVVVPYNMSRSLVFIL